MNSQTICKLLIISSAAVMAEVYAQPQYTEEQKKIAVERLANKVSQGHQQQVQNMDNYNKNLYKINEARYKGKSVSFPDLPDYRADPNLTDAQRNTIHNQIVRAELIKDMIEGKR